MKITGRVGQSVQRNMLLSYICVFALSFLMIGGCMKEIPLTQGKIALVDDEDYVYLKLFNWHYSQTKHYTGYARSWYNNKKVLMHRLIIFCSKLINLNKIPQIDHINQNGLDNRKNNLRFVTNSQNQANKNRCYKGKRHTKFKGVFWRKEAKAWTAAIRKDYKLYYIGYFKNEIEAAKAYNKKAIELYGEYASLNYVGLCA